MKKILSLILAICIFAGLVPTAFAIDYSLECGLEKDELTAYLKDGTLPAGAQVMLEEKFDSYTGAIKVGKWNEVTGNTYLKIVEEDGGKILHAASTDDKEHGPRVAKKLNYEGLETFWVEASFRSDFDNWRLALRDGTKATIANEPYPTQGKWVTVKAYVDLVTATMRVYIDGKFQEEKTISNLDLTSENLEVRIAWNVDPNKTVDCKDIRLFTTDVFEGLIVGIDGKVHLENVKAQNPTGYLQVMRDTHPRVLVTDWDVIREKIAQYPVCATWYNQLKTQADTWLRVECVPYGNNARNNANDASQSVRNRLVTHAIVAAISGETKYKDKAMEEMRNIRDAWPDWGEDGAYLIAAQIILAHSLCYDWMYHMLSESEKAEICAMMEERGFALMVQGYEGKLALGHVLWAEHNQNMVGNASNAVAAIAFGTDYPELAEYVLEKVSIHMPKCFYEVGADGSFCEPYEYWNFGMGHTLKCMAALDSALADGKNLPAVLDFSDTPGFDKCGDFPMYYQGDEYAFSYGASTAHNDAFGVMLYLAKKYDKPEYAQWYLNNQPNPPQSQGTYRSIAYALLFYDDAVANRESTSLTLDKFFSGDGKYNANGMAVRASWADQSKLTAFMQCGDNQAFHSYHSLGNFVIDWAGERWITTTGKNSASYSYNYESKVKSAGGNSEDIYWHRTEGNNCIVINPDASYGQKSDAKALLVKSESGADGAYGIFDMTATFDGILSAKRGMMLTNNRSRLLVQDEYTLSAPSEVYWFAHTGANITLSADGKAALLEKNGKKMYAKLLNAPAGIGFTVMQSGPLQTSPNPDKQQAEFKAEYTGDKKLTVHATNVKEFNVSLLFVPIEEGMEIPNETESYIPMQNWKIVETPHAADLGETVALMIDNPVAYAKGKKCYVDANNQQIVPFTQNGRTLVPVRFISESFGAAVGWNESTQTVSVDYNGAKISMRLGENEMLVNGKTVALDVAPQTVGGRTMLPLRAMVEAIGKKVHWDDRGLILIGNLETYSNAQVEAALRKLDVRVFVGDAELLGFDEDTKQYTLPLSAQGAISVTSTLYAPVTVQGNPASMNLFGKTYNFSFVADPFVSQLGTDAVVEGIAISSDTMKPAPDYPSYLQVAGVQSSTGWDGKYPESGTIDGVINDEIVNRWSGEGKQWLIYDLGSVQTVYSMSLATLKSDTRTFTLSIETSEDGTNWTMVHPEATTLKQPYATCFEIGKSARYIRLNTLRASEGTFHSYTEVRFYDSVQMQDDDMMHWKWYLNLSICEGKVGETARLSVQGLDKQNKRIDLDDKYTLVFESLDENVATVDANGVVTFKGRGSTKIRARAVVEALGMARESEIDVFVQ